MSRGRFVDDCWRMKRAQDGLINRESMGKLRRACLFEEIDRDIRIGPANRSNER